MAEEIIEGIQNSTNNCRKIIWTFKLISSRSCTTNCFDIDGAPNIKWYIKYTSSSNTYPNFSLLNKPSSDYKFQNKLKIEIVIGNLQNSQSYTQITNCFERNTYFIENSYLKKLCFPDGTFHLRLIVTTLETEGKFQIDNVPTNFQPFLFNEILSDVVFLIDNINIPAHKIILASASPVFEKMFSHKMKENITNVVEIKDADPDDFKEMLSYIYTGEIKNLETMAFGICKLANKYDIPKLLSICEESLQQFLSVDNVVSTLELADQHNSVDLKKECIKFIQIHFNEVEETEAFKNIKKKLLLSLFSAIMSLNAEKS